MTPSKPNSLIQPAVQLRIGPPQILAAAGILHNRSQLLQVQRLQQIVERSSSHGIDRRLDRAVACHEDDLGIRLQLAALGQHFQPADIRHLQIGDHDLERSRFEQRDRFLAAAGNRAGEPHTSQAVRHRLSVRVVIVDDQHLNRRSSSGGSRGLRRHATMIRPIQTSGKGTQHDVNANSNRLRTLAMSFPSLVATQSATSLPRNPRRHRQLNRNLRPMPHFALNADSPAVGVHDLLRRRQPQA